MTDERKEKYAAAIAKSDGLDWETIKAQHPLDVDDYRRNAVAAVDVADAELRSRDEYWVDLFAGKIREIEARAAGVARENTRLRDQLADITSDYERALGDQNLLIAERDQLLADLARATGRDVWSDDE